MAYASNCGRQGVNRWKNGGQRANVGRVIPLPARRCTISCKASRYSSLRHIWTDLGGYRWHEDYGGRRYERYWEHHGSGIRPQTDFSRQNLSFLPLARRGARGFSALAPIVVSGSTQPATVLRPVHRSRGLSIPRGWEGYLYYFHHTVK